jgi:membrane protease YdiL (CAAX protease family)
MPSFVSRLSYQAEIAIVVAITFGPFIASSLFAIVHPVAQPPINDAALRATIALEFILGALALGFLALRGWRAAALDLNIGWRSTGEGVVLLIAATIAYASTEWVAGAVFDLDAPALAAGLVQPGLGLVTIAVVSIVNPVFEEVFVSGYLVSTLRSRHGIATAINVSVAVRLMYHLYQGVLGAVTIIPVGLVFAYWYARRRSLWSLIVAHALLDLISLSYHGA